MSILTRKRLDVPEVHRLLAALDYQLDNWSETTDGSPERRDLWRRVHSAAAELGERVYGGPTMRVRFSYWIRPYDPKRDDRCWRWQRMPCFSLDVR